MKTYYVAKNGEDKDNFGGNENQSWLTGIYAMTRIKGGDTLVLDDGVYAEAWRNTIPSGTQANPTTIRALNSKKAILRPNDGKFYVVAITQPRSWIVLDGLDVDATGCLYSSFYYAADHGEVSNIVTKNGLAHGSKDDGQYGPAGIVAGYHSNVAGHHHFSFLNMESYDHRNNFGPDAIDGYGLYLMCSDTLVEGCYFHGNGGYQITQYTTGRSGCDRNIYTANRIDGSNMNKNYSAVILTSGKDCRFFKNDVVGSNSRAGVDVCYDQHSTIIEDNTIRNSAYYAVRLLALPGVSTKIQVINNRFDGNQPDEVLDELPDSVITGNVVGPIIPSPIPPIQPPIEPPVIGPKKYKFAATGTGFAASGEITLEEL